MTQETAPSRSRLDCPFRAATVRERFPEKTNAAAIS